MRGHPVQPGGAGIAERVVAGNQPHDVVLEVRIERTRTVSGTERVFFGALAGRNTMVSDDRLPDRNGTVLRSFMVESASAAHLFSGESGASDAYCQFATNAVSALRQRLWLRGGGPATGLRQS